MQYITIIIFKSYTVELWLMGVPGIKSSTIGTLSLDICFSTDDTVPLASYIFL